jgi:uncharacterized protein (DUF1697 family)
MTLIDRNNWNLIGKRSLQRADIHSGLQMAKTFWLGFSGDIDQDKYVSKIITTSRSNMTTLRAWSLTRSSATRDSLARGRL